MEPYDQHLIEAMAVVDLDPSLNRFHTTQQKWITSLEFTTNPTKAKSEFKYLTITPGLFLIIGYCQPNKPPIYEIDFFAKPPPEWINIKISNSFLDIFGACLCYKNEEVESLEPLSDIEMLHIERKSRFGENKEVINVPTGYKLISHPIPYGYLVYRKVRSKAEHTFRAILTQKYPSTISKINLSQLPIFCFPEGIKLSREIRGFSTFNFIFTLETAKRIYVNCLLFKENLSQNHRKRLDLKLNDNIFYQKALCIISSYCYTDEFGECLQRLYRLSLSKSNVPFSKVIQNIFSSLLYPDEIPKFGLCYDYGGPPIYFNTNDAYPFVSERAIYTIFKFLTVDHIINVFEALMLEKKILFVSQSKTVLGYASEAFTALLFPFHWEQVLIPILSYTLKDYLNAPVPLIAGISPALVDSSIESQSVIVYLDRNQILNDEDLPPLPEKLMRQLRKRLEKLEVYDKQEVTEYLQNPESTYLFKMQEVQDPHFHGNEVRDIFLEFLLTLMRNYRRFWIKQKEKKLDLSNYDLEEPQLMNDLFKVQDFLSDLGMTKIGSFGFKFTESSIFTAFIEKRQRNPTDPEIKFFDNCLEKRKAKKQTSFITPVKNQKYINISGPKIEEEKIYHYEKFPSLLQEKNSKEEQALVEQQENDLQSKAISIIEEEMFTNSDLYEPSREQFEEPIHRQIHDLLLNQNKALFPYKHISNNQIIFNWFLQTYTSQITFIDDLFTNWPSSPSPLPFKAVTKKEYLIMGVKAGENQVVGVSENGDYQMLINGEDVILFGSGKLIPKKLDTMIVSFRSCRLKMFINTIIPKQSGFLMEYCRQKMVGELRKSTFRTRNVQGWTIETIMDLHEWIKKAMNDLSQT